MGRCFPFWQDVMACYVVNTSAEDDSGKKKCGASLEDYYECLHHKKEVCCAPEPGRGWASTDDTTARAGAGDTGSLCKGRDGDAEGRCAERQTNTELGAAG